jgi:hypothetical protein
MPMCFFNAFIFVFGLLALMLGGNLNITPLV